MKTKEKKEKNTIFFLLLCNSGIGNNNLTAGFLTWEF